MRLCVLSLLQADVFSLVNRLARTMLTKKKNTHTRTHTRLQLLATFQPVYPRASSGALSHCCHKHNNRKKQKKNRQITKGGKEDESVGSLSLSLFLAHLAQRMTSVMGWCLS